ncbi:HEAT repeat domain-containing protein, partial [Desulfobulbus sp. US4]|nr:HEAT repeat domain-containing protein [Desulfobulbus sp. US4]
LLKDSDGNVRSAAVDALGQLGVDSAVPHIIPLLKDSDWSVRSAAVDALGQLGMDLVTPQLISILNTNLSIWQGWRISPPWYQKEAVETLGRLGSASAAPQIISLIMDSEGSMRSAAVQALGKLQATARGMNISFSQFVEQQKQRLVVAKKKSISKNPVSREEAAGILGGIFTKQAVALLTNIMEDPEEKKYVVKKAVESIGMIGEYRPGIVLGQVPTLLTLSDRADLRMRKIAITALGRLIASQDQKRSAKVIETEKKIRAKLYVVLADPKEKHILRRAALDALSKSGNLEDLNKLKEQFNVDLKDRFTQWRYRHLKDSGEIRKELDKIKKEKEDWRRSRDREDISSVDDTGINGKQMQDVWRKEHLEYLLGHSWAARIASEADIEELFGHSLYQVRQGAIYGLAAKADAPLIGKIIQAHQNFDPDDLPSPFPYTAFRAIDLALWNLEYTGKKDDVTKLQDILKNLKPCQVPGQEGAIKERLEWTIDRLDENITKNAELAAAE